MRVMRFCRLGTRSSGSSTPRSPRATISASEASRMLSSRSMACGFSIFDMMAARPRTRRLASCTSSARCTKDRAIQSIPVSSAASRSRRSFGVIADTGRSVSGRLTPLRSEMRPPTTTRVTARSFDVSSAISRNLPSSISSAWPGRSAARISGCGRCTRVASPAAGSESSTKLSPFLSCTPPSAKAPTRSFGPCRSTRIPIGRP